MADEEEVSSISSSSGSFPGQSTKRKASLSNSSLQKLNSGTKKSKFSSKKSKNAKKSKSKNLNPFEEEVEVATSDEESDYELQKEEGVEDVELTEHERQTEMRYAERQKRLDAMNKITEEDIVRGIEERHNRQRAPKGTRLGHTEVELSRNANLPTVTDPKLYAVRCKPGEERLLIVRLMGKFKYEVQRQAKMKNKPATASLPTVTKIPGQNQMNILSAVWPGTKGYVYVEAFAEQSVRNALFGLRDVFQKLTLVPLNEMVAVLRVSGVVSSTNYDRNQNVNLMMQKLQPGQFVRLKNQSGVYKNDLAQVQKVIFMGNNSRVVVKLVPRLDFELIKLMLKLDLSVEDENSENFNVEEKIKERKTRKIIPNKEMLNREKLSNLGVEIEKNVYEATGEFLEYVQMIDSFFKDGFLLKEVTGKQIKITEVNPTFEELQEFNIFQEKEAADFAKVEANLKSLNAFAGDNDEAKGFQVGDIILVTKGQYANLVAKIIEISKNFAKGAPSNGKENYDDDETEEYKSRFNKYEALKTTNKDYDIVIKVRPTHHEIADQIVYFSPDEIMKFFSVGQHVKILSGEHLGETGTVVKIDQQNETATVFTDIDKQEVISNVKSLQLTTEVSSGRDHLMNYQLYDFVRLTDNSVGVITRIGTDKLSVLNNFKKELSVSVSEIKFKIRTNNFRVTFNDSIALDANQNQVHAGDRVNITSGKNKNVEGQVKFIHQSTLFLHSKQQNSNAGMVVEYSKNCFVIGATNTSANTDNRLNKIPNSNFGRFRIQEENMELQGKSVRITKGKFKGLVGMVVGLKGNLLKVELHAKAKTVMIEKSGIVDLSAKDEPRKSYETFHEPRPPKTSIEHTDFHRKSQLHQMPMTPTHDPFEDQNEGKETDSDDDHGYDEPEVKGGTYNPPRDHEERYSLEEKEAENDRTVAHSSAGAGYNRHNVKTPAIASNSFNRVKTPAVAYGSSRVKTPGVAETSRVKTPAFAASQANLYRIKTPALAQTAKNTAYNYYDRLKTPALVGQANNQGGRSIINAPKTPALVSGFSNNYDEAEHNDNGGFKEKENVKIVNGNLAGQVGVFEGADGDDVFVIVGENLKILKLSDITKVDS